MSRLAARLRSTDGRVVATCLAAGILIAFSLPPWGFWPLAFAGILLLDRVIADQPAASRFRRGWLVGFALIGPTMAWLKEMTFPGYLIAVAFYAAGIGLAMMACPPGPGRRLALPAAWLLAESWRGSWPFGGVPMSTLAVGQVGGPLAPVARLGGTLLLAAVTMGIGVALAAAVRREWRPAALAGGLAVAVLLGAMVAPRGEDVGRSLQVALVQGGGPQGTRAVDTDERVVFERHLAASQDVPPGMDLTVWPEDVVDTDGPVIDEREGEELADLARQLDTTLIAGVVEGAGENFFRNASVAWNSDGEVVDRYDKVHRVPFGEYVPLRSLIEPLGGGALPGRDAIAGTEPAVLDTPAGPLAVVISWEVFFGHRARDGVSEGGQVLLNPTNGSSFTRTLVQTQQIASSRLRAIETGRWVVQVAPTGFSAFVTPDGEVLQRTGVSERAVRVQQVQAREGLTIYTRTGDRPIIALALLVVAAAWVLARRRDRSSGIDVDQDGDGAVVDQVHRHVGPEPTGGHPGAETP